jgi:hypothetical protein
MKLRNKHELTQLKWEVDSLIDIVEQMTGDKPSNEINLHQNEDVFPKMIFGIRKHLLALEWNFTNTKVFGEAKL